LFGGPWLTHSAVRAITPHDGRTNQPNFGRGIVHDHTRLQFGGHLSRQTGLESDRGVLSGIHLMSIGIVGEYLGRIYDEVKQRPKFVVKKTVGIQQEGRHD